MPMTTYCSLPPTQTTDRDMLELINVINSNWENEDSQSRIYVEEHKFEAGMLWWKHWETTYHTLVLLPYPDGSHSNEYQCINIGVTRDCVLSYLYGYFLGRKGHTNEKNV